MTKAQRQKEWEDRIAAYQASVEVTPGFDPAMLSEIIHILVAVC